MSDTVWKDEAGRARLEQWFGRFRERIPVPTESRHVPTRHGPGHVLLAGPADAPPIVCLHAMRTGSAHLLAELGSLARGFRLIAPDLPGQSVRGPQVRLSLRDDSCARWVLEVLDGLRVDTFGLFGISWGGFVARQTASTEPRRVRRLALMVPAGIANGSHWKGLTAMALPMVRYRLRPSRANLQRLLEPLLTTWDEDWADYMGATLRDLRTDLRIPPPATDAELHRLTMPVLVLGAADDISFPGRAVVERVRSILPQAETEVIPGCKHCPPTTEAFRTWLSSRLETFFGGQAPQPSSATGADRSAS